MKNKKQLSPINHVTLACHIADTTGELMPTSNKQPVSIMDKVFIFAIAVIAVVMVVSLFK